MAAPADDSASRASAAGHISEAGQADQEAQGADAVSAEAKPRAEVNEEARQETETEPGVEVEANEEEEQEDGDATIKELWESAVQKVTRALEKQHGLGSEVCNAILHNSPDAPAAGLLSFSCEAVFVAVSRGLVALTGYAEEAMLGQGLRMLDVGASSLNGAEYECMDKYLSSQASEFTGLFLHQRRDETYFWDFVHMRRLVLSSTVYFFVVTTPLSLKLPATLCRASNLEEAQMSRFVDKLRDFLRSLRPHLHAKAMQYIPSIVETTTQSITSWMKTNTNEFEGDHWVPLDETDKAYIFQHDVKWTGILRRVQNALFTLWDKSASDAVACAVSDPVGEDCPLVYISPEFEKLTGYSREWVLGRNCRFLQPNHRWRNAAFNQEECLRMRAFCKQPMAESTRIVNLLVNERKGGYPFWNLLVMEHIEVECDAATSIGNVSSRPYIFGVQTTLSDEIFRLTEVLAMDTVGLAQLQRLRNMFREGEPALGKMPLPQFARHVLQKWGSGFPSNVFQLPLVRMMPGSIGQPYVDLPVAGLEVTAASIVKELPLALQHGVRHFYLHFSLDTQGPANVADAALAEAEVRLLALRLAEALAMLRESFLHYLREGVSFTLVSPPQYVKFAGMVFKSARSHGYHFNSWLLDLRHPTKAGSRPMPLAALADRWKCMAESVEAGDTNALGLCGASMEVYHHIQKLRKVAPISIFAQSTYPGKKIRDLREYQFFEELFASNATVVAYEIFGPDDRVLKHMQREPRQEVVGELAHCDASVVLAMWARSHAHAVMLPSFPNSDAAPPETARPAGSPPASAAGTDGAPDEPRAALPGEAMGERGQADVHRSFVKAFNRASLSAAASDRHSAMHGAALERHLAMYGIAVPSDAPAGRTRVVEATGTWRRPSGCVAAGSPGLDPSSTLSPVRARRTLTAPLDANVASLAEHDADTPRVAAGRRRSSPSTLPPVASRRGASKERASKESASSVRGASKESARTTCSAGSANARAEPTRAVTCPDFGPQIPHALAPVPVPPPTPPTGRPAPCWRNAPPADRHSAASSDTALLQKVALLSMERAMSHGSSSTGEPASLATSRARSQTISSIPEWPSEAEGPGGAPAGAPPAVCRLTAASSPETDEIAALRQQVGDARAQLDEVAQQRRAERDMYEREIKALRQELADRAADARIMGA